MNKMIIFYDNHAETVIWAGNGPFGFWDLKAADETAYKKSGANNVCSASSFKESLRQTVERIDRFAVYPDLKMEMDAACDTVAPIWAISCPWQTRSPSDTSRLRSDRNR
jgi:hypothetical protein